MISQVGTRRIDAVEDIDARAREASAVLDAERDYLARRVPQECGPPVEGQPYTRNAIATVKRSCTTAHTVRTTSKCVFARGRAYSVLIRCAPLPNGDGAV